MKNAHFASPCRILPAVFALLTLWTWSAAPPAGAQDYENAIASKLTAIQWKEADLKAAQRELAILTQFLSGYDEKAANLETARQQLAGADAQLAIIQQDNLVKLTIRMGIETYNTVSDTVNLGKAAATALVTRGVSSAVGAAALDQLTNGLTKEGQKALGMDAESLSTARTVKIKAVSDAAAAAYPELARVQQMLAMSLEGVKAAAYHEDGTELGDTGAILRKNIMVREEITAALAKLDVVGTEAGTAKTDAETGLTAAQADVDRLTAELAALQNELNALKAEWASSEAAARLAANQAAVVPPADLPVPTPAVGPQGEDESDYDYQQRQLANIRAQAQAQWDAGAPALLTEIDGLKTEIQTAQAEIDTAVETFISATYLDDFINGYSGDDTVSADATASYEGAISAAAGLETWMAKVTPAQTALPGLIEKVETLTDNYNSLANLQNRLQSLGDLLWEVGLSPSYGTAMVTPGMGQNTAEELAVSLDQKLSQLPKALANAQTQLDQLSAATAAWGSGIGSVSTDIGDSLAATESALSVLIAKGAAWDAALAAAGPEMTVDFTSPAQPESRLGYFSGANFVRVVERAFNLYGYQTAMLAAAATPGAAGLAAARDLRARYDALVAATPALKDAFDAARQTFKAAFARLESYAGGTTNFAVLDDWSRAATYKWTAHPVDASGVTDQAARYQSLYYTSKQYHATSLTGGDPVVGQGVVFWQGLPRLSQLPDPGMDDPAAFLPHRLAAAKAAIVEESPGWIPLPPDQFNARYTEVFDKLMQLSQEAQDANDGSLDKVMAVFGELGDVQDAYVAAHPAPTITVQPAGARKDIDAGTTCTVQLSVTAAGHFLTYQWYMTRYVTDEFGWEEIAGATSRELTTPALSETRWFKVTISNPGGAITSDAAHVEVYQIYPAAVFTSPASASARVGVSFSWTFTTDIPGAWIFIQGMGLPAGLNFSPMTATLSGIPTAAGTFDVTVNASNQGTFSSQTFRLTVAPGSEVKGDVDGNGAVTVADAVCALQVCSGIVPASVNALSDVNGDGKIGLDEAAYALQQAAELR